MTADDIMVLCDQVRDTAYAVHVYHGNGYLEKFFENVKTHWLIVCGKRASASSNNTPLLFKMKTALLLASTSPIS